MPSHTTHSRKLFGRSSALNNGCNDLHVLQTRRRDGNLTLQRLLPQTRTRPIRTRNMPCTRLNRGELRRLLLLHPHQRRTGLTGRLHLVLILSLRLSRVSSISSPTCSQSKRRRSRLLRRSQSRPNQFQAPTVLRSPEPVIVLVRTVPE